MKRLDIKIDKDWIVYKGARLDMKINNLFISTEDDRSISEILESEYSETRGEIRDKALSKILKDGDN